MGGVRGGGGLGGVAVRCQIMAEMGGWDGMGCHKEPETGILFCFNFQGGGGGLVGAIVRFHQIMAEMG